MSLVERLKEILATVDEDDRLHTDEETGEEEELEKATNAEKPAEKQDGKPKLGGKRVRKQITLGSRPINVDLSKEVERFNK